MKIKIPIKNSQESIIYVLVIFKIMSIKNELHFSQSLKIQQTQLNLQSKGVIQIKGVI